MIERPAVSSISTERSAFPSQMSARSPMTCEHILFEVGTADAYGYRGPVDIALLDRALTDAAPVRPLPEDIAALLREVAAPPRLAAHLRAVHDAAWQLTAAIIDLYPALRFDREEVLFGAATHDIGKTIHPDELSQPGTRHEQTGYELLVESGVEHRLARFAANHGTWTAPDISTEDLLVSLADKIWKANGSRTSKIASSSESATSPARTAGRSS